MAEPDERQELERELETELAALKPVGAELRQELRALRAGLGSTAELEQLDEEDWPSDNGSGHDHGSWASPPPPPLPRPVIVPRLILETAFLVAAAAVAVLADLEPLWIVAVMAGAWLLVALSEWAAFAKQRRWRLDEVAPPLAEGGSAAWYVPPVERTMLQAPSSDESHTVVSSPSQDETEVRRAAPALEETGELAVEPRRRFWRRRKSTPDTPPGADPWVT